MVFRRITAPIGNTKTSKWLKIPDPVTDPAPCTEASAVESDEKTFKAAQKHHLMLIARSDGYCLQVG
jgi:hypothetical protein